MNRFFWKFLRIFCPFFENEWYFSLENKAIFNCEQFISWKSARELSSGWIPQQNVFFQTHIFQNNVLLRRSMNFAADTKKPELVKFPSRIYYEIALGTKGVEETMVVCCIIFCPISWLGHLLGFLCIKSPQKNEVFASISKTWNRTWKQHFPVLGSQGVFRREFLAGLKCSRDFKNDSKTGLSSECFTLKLLCKTSNLFQR